MSADQDVSPHQDVVAVGVDDSAGADAAVSWAIEDARSRHVPLRVVCAYKWVLAYGRMPTYAPAPEPDSERNREAAEELVAVTIAKASDAAEGFTRDGVAVSAVPMTGNAVDGKAVPVLVEESARAAVLVLGSRQWQGPGSAVLGSVAAAVAARAVCPVVVVRGPAPDATEVTQVVVGIDGTDASQRVLEFAFSHASRHRIPLRAVLCWRPDLLDTVLRRADTGTPERAEVALSEALAGWREQYPDVEVSSTIRRDHAVVGLVAESATQHLLVVGSRGDHALTGTLLGSVSQGVLHHATCPVAVVPRRAE